jgi:glycosyltransferase involved in cell wall biosynthesis
LAATTLRKFTTLRPTLPYYGSVQAVQYEPRRFSGKIEILYSGTITPETGSNIFADALCTLSREHPQVAKSISVHVTGTGDGLFSLRRLSAALPNIELIVHGRLSADDYQDLLKKVIIGLSLKKIHGSLADSTFPSKVVEYAAAGLYIIATDISDVRRVLGDHAHFITSNGSSELVEAIIEAVAIGKVDLEHRSRKLHAHVMHTLSFDETGKDLLRFIEGVFEQNG